MVIYWYVLSLTNLSSLVRVSIIMLDFGQEIFEPPKFCLLNFGYFGSDRGEDFPFGMGHILNIIQVEFFYFQWLALGWGGPG